MKPAVTTSLIVVISLSVLCEKWRVSSTTPFSSSGFDLWRQRFFMIHTQCRHRQCWINNSFCFAQLHKIPAPMRDVLVILYTSCTLDFSQRGVVWSCELWYLVYNV